MKRTFYTLITTVIILIGFSFNNATAQCTDFDAGPFTDLNTAFGGAPCDDGTGCAIMEFTTFEVFASEAYVIDNFVEGEEYSFSICNGPGAGTWIPDFTITAPSGAIDAFGLPEGETCTISWIASESGTYTLGINEEGQCGGGPNLAVGNGFPAITCLSGAPCPEPQPEVTACNAGTLETFGSVTLCDIAETFDFLVEGDTVPDGGTFAIVIDDQLGGTGAVPGFFNIGGATNTTLVLDADLTGILSYNNLEPLSGPWVFRGAVIDSSNNFCSFTVDTLIVFFGTESPSIVDIVSNGVDELTVNATGGVPPYSYLWDDANAQTTQTAVGLEPGVFTVLVVDANGCLVEGESTFTVSTNSIASLNELNISPSPTTGAFSVQLALEKNDMVKVEVLDLVGRVIRTTQREALADRFEFNLNDKAAGVYFVRISVGAESITQKIVVSK